MIRYLLLTASILTLTIPVSILGVSASLAQSTDDDEPGADGNDDDGDVPDPDDGGGDNGGNPEPDGEVGSDPGGSDPTDADPGGSDPGDSDVGSDPGSGDTESGDDGAGASSGGTSGGDDDDAASSSAAGDDDDGPAAAGSPGGDDDDDAPAAAGGPGGDDDDGAGDDGADDDDAPAAPGSPSADDDDDGASDDGGDDSGTGPETIIGGGDEDDDERAMFDARDGIEVDKDGFRYRKNEFVALDLPQSDITLLQAEGFRVVETARLDSIGSTVSLIKSPAKRSDQDMLSQIESISGAASISFNYLFDTSTARIKKASKSAVRKRTACGCDIGLIDTGVATKAGFFKHVQVQQKAFNGAAVIPKVHGTGVAYLFAGTENGAAKKRTRVFVGDIFGGDRSQAGSSFALVKALDWMGQMKVPVINVSLAGPRSAAVAKTVERLTRKGHIVVAAAGNDGPAAPPVFPGAYPDVVAVTAVDSQSRVYRYANRGNYIDLSSHGVEVPLIDNGGVPVVATGTSFASPTVARKLARAMARPDVAAAKAADRDGRARRARPRGAGAGQYIWSWSGQRLSMLVGLIAMTTAGMAIPASIALPRYNVSDAFVYSDGRVERVKAIRGDRITWVGLNNIGYTRSRNFSTPILNWRFGKGTGRREIVGDANTLWPLAKPKTVRFRAIAFTKPKPMAGVRRAMTLWTCSSKKPQTTQTPLGAFATIPIICDRYSATSMRLIERIEWNYSPDLRHYVRRSSVDYYRGTRSTILLTAALSGPAANLRRLTALSRAARAANKK